MDINGNEQQHTTMLYFLLYMLSLWVNCRVRAAHTTTTLKRRRVRFQCPHTIDYSIFLLVHIHSSVSELGMAILPLLLLYMSTFHTGRQVSLDALTYDNFSTSYHFLGVNFSHKRRKMKIKIKKKMNKVYNNNNRSSNDMSSHVVLNC